MKTLLKLEEGAELLLAIVLAYTTLPFAWWWYWALFLTPDVGMLGYAVNARVGALTYNLLHHKAVAIACYVLGLYTASAELQFTGLLLFGHSAFDRLFGYGLKFPDAFKHTHLGWIGE